MNRKKEGFSYVWFILITSQLPELMLNISNNSSKGETAKSHLEVIMCQA